MSIRPPTRRRSDRPAQTHRRERNTLRQQLLETFPTWDSDLHPSQHVTLLVGPTNSGKTFWALDQRWPYAEALTFLGHAALQRGDFALAQQRYAEALAFYQELEDRPNIASLNSCIRAALFGMGGTKPAIARYQEKLSISNELKDY
jgi:hypothetical protein